jgi:hypothetical protein
LDDDGTFHPCIWDSRNYGSSGWIFGSGVFKAGDVHLSATVEGGYYVDSSGNEMADIGIFEISEWDLSAGKR